MNIFNKIYWFLYRLTPRGRKAYTFKKGFEGLLISNGLKRSAKMKVVHSANKNLKEKKILAFKKGESISKSKKSAHQVIRSVEKKHGTELKERGIKITKTGKFKNT